jgi:deoxyribonuclease V
MQQLTYTVNTAPIRKLPIVNSAIIISNMKIQNLHGWQISVAEAKKIQLELAEQVSHQSEAIQPRYIAGVDISAPDSTGIARAAVVILEYPELQVTEIKTTEDKLNFPYIPGLLSFREAPLILAACRKLSINPDLMLVDGHGIAHPRRFGIASHLGLLLDLPSIGCAKSRLCGTHSPVNAGVGDYAELVDNDEIIGAALRSKIASNPIYISIGHMIDLPTAIQMVMKCCRGYRLPEPARLAHLAASGKSINAFTSRQWIAQSSNILS